MSPKPWVQPEWSLCTLLKQTLNTFRFLAALVGHSVDPVALAAQPLDGVDVGVAEEQAFPLLLTLLVGRCHVEGGAASRLEALLAAAVGVARRGRGRLGPALGVAAVPTRAPTTSGSDQLAG